MDEMDIKNREERADAQAGEGADERLPEQGAPAADGSVDDGNLTAAIEAILFAMGGSVEADRMAQALEVPLDFLQNHVERMMDEYEQSDRGIRIIRLEDSYQLCTKKEYYETLIRIAKVPRKIHLTDVLLETLSIIAYKQPVTKLEIEKIRGVKSDHAVNKLVEYELVAELGRLDAPGRPILFGTTEDFLRHFGVASLEELPVVDPLAREDFKLEAEQEIDRRLGTRPGQAGETSPADHKDAAQNGEASSADAGAAPQYDEARSGHGNTPDEDNMPETENGEETVQV